MSVTGDAAAFEARTCLRDIAAIIDADLGRANVIAERALSKGLRHPAFHKTRALWFQSQNRHADALDEFRQAAALAPHDVNLLDAVGLGLVRLDRAAAAIPVFDAAIRIAPAWAQLHYHKGCAHAVIGEPAAAIRCHERAVALQPDHVDALTAVAAATARVGETKKARAFAERALKLVPDNPTAVIALATCDLHDRQFERAERRLDALLVQLHPEDPTRALTLGLLGDALDGQNRVAEAFMAFSSKNNILRTLNESRFSESARALNFVERLTGDFKRTSPRPWERTAGTASVPHSRQHVFLLGFMRSGTTLLEQALASHPDVEDLEERETLKDLAARYLGNPESLRELSVLNGDLLAEAQNYYWNCVRAFGARPEGKIFVEKQPFNTLYLPLIARLFPEARIIFSLRDPRDVVLSCFRRHLEIKTTTFEVLTLAGAARFYDRVMRLAGAYRSGLSLDLCDFRYEDMIRDFDGSVRSICGFIGLSWNESMRDFDRTARTRSVRSPSAHQVRRGLYADGIGQWRRYQKELSPILPILKPWIERFGYALD
ncbi:MAG TPA: sulfotransferase [Rhizomicrobium sp.]|jgi:tetratricopeptide (TPR) repeat protein